MVETNAAGLANVLEAARADAVDLVIVDRRPSVEAKTSAALRAADLSLIPTRAATIDLRAIPATAKLARDAKAKAALVLNQCRPSHDGTTGVAIVQEARRVLSGYGLLSCPVSVAQRVASGNSLNDGPAVTEYEPAEGG